MVAWRFVPVVLVAAPLLAANIAAHAQGEPLAIDGDGSVKIGTASSNVWLNGKVGVGSGKSKPAHSLDVNGTVSADAFVGMGAVPVGAILMWSGSASEVPKGWVLCDGREYDPQAKSKAPDLRGRFIVAYDDRDTDYSQPGKTGGQKAVTLTIEQMPQHGHSGTTDNSSFPKENPMGRSTRGLDTAYASGVKSTDQVNHQHRFTTDSVGGGQPHENRPPFYVLAYIMYTGK